MQRNLRWKALIIVFVVGLAFWRAYPFNRETIHLGLDLQGGIHLVLEVQAEQAVKARADRIISDMRIRLRDDKVSLTSLRRLANDDIELLLANAADADKLADRIATYQDIETVSQENGATYTYRFSRGAKRNIEESAVDQGIEIIRNRIDEFGVAEPTVQRQGQQRIIVELPGVDDPERAINLIGRTALLEFKLVDDDSSLREALDGDVPGGDQILYQRVTDKTTGQVTRNPFLIKRETLITGDLLTNAEVNFDQQFNEPYVMITFDKVGARLFSQLTGENVRKRLAIILDNNVYSAPVIQEKIPGGEARITGNFTVEEARDLAIVLRAGSLPAPVTILENRTVGPSLGQDSIDRGVISILIAGALVVMFMIVYYRLAGLLADLALALNLLLLLGVMAQLGATLTLPGIAGIILTVGMAVDANVLIFERIREELRQAKSVRAAVDQGYARAFRTILDANVTTLLAAVVLFQFGSGPVKGFAVTLSIGILASMFTAIFVTRTIFEFILTRWRIARLSI